MKPALRPLVYFSLGAILALLAAYSLGGSNAVLLVIGLAMMGLGLCAHLVQTIRQIKHCEVLREWTIIQDGRTIDFGLAAKMAAFRTAAGADKTSEGGR